MDKSHKHLNKNKMSSGKKKSSLQAALMTRPVETTEKVIKEEFIENAQPVQS